MYPKPVTSSSQSDNKRLADAIPHGSSGVANVPEISTGRINVSIIVTVIYYAKLK
jgi:hypothetical protein